MSRPGFLLALGDIERCLRVIQKREHRDRDIKTVLSAFLLDILRFCPPVRIPFRPFLIEELEALIPVFEHWKRKPIG